MSLPYRQGYSPLNMYSPTYMEKSFLSLLLATALLAGCETKHSDTKDELSEASQDTAVMARTGQTAGDMAQDATASAADTWALAKDEMADVKFTEIKTPNVRVRATADSTYNVYDVDETVLFDTDKAEIKPTATAALSEIAGSIGKRYGTKMVRVMGYADARGDKDYNKDLSESRAEAVKDYLVSNGNIAAERVSVEPMGEAMPVATNATPAGRKQNRRVEIAVRNK